MPGGYGRTKHVFFFWHQLWGCSNRTYARGTPYRRRVSYRSRTRRIRRWHRREKHSVWFLVTRIALITIVAVPTLVLVVMAIRND